MRKISVHSELIVFENLNQLDLDSQLLMEKAIAARENAYAPYSKFYVGTAILLENGEIITGSNQENAAYPSGLWFDVAVIAIFMISTFG